MSKVVQLYWIKSKGVSLIELGVVILFISLALVPVINTIGGPRSSSGKGNAIQLNSVKAKETILANTMVDKVLSGDLRNIDCDPETDVDDLPTGNTSKTFAKCDISGSNGSLQSQWTVVNLNSTNNGTNMPEKNLYYQATLNIIDKTNGSTVFTLPMNFFRNTGGYTTIQDKIGVVLSMDISDSMADSSYRTQNFRLPQINSRFAAPYMFYRYKDNNGLSPFPKGPSNWGPNFSVEPTSTEGKFLLDKWDNANLDMVFGQQIQGQDPGKDPDTSTPYNEAFPFAKVASASNNGWGDGLLGTGDCTTLDATNDKNFKFAFIPTANATMDIGNESTKKPGVANDLIKGLCSEKSSHAAWSAFLNDRLSKIEAARTATLSFLLKLEGKASVAKAMELAYVPWGSSLDSIHVVNPEGPKTVAGKLRFVNNRDRLLWINRADPANKNSTKPVVVQPVTGTNMRAGLVKSVNILPAANYKKRIIVFLTDGKPYPESGKNTFKELRTYAKTIGKQNITMYTIGLMLDDGQTGAKDLLKDMAASTPDGKHFFVDDVTNLRPVFDTISYQIQKEALLASAKRYGVSF